MVKGQEVSIVQVIHMVAPENEDRAGIETVQGREILVEGIGGAPIPMGVDLQLGWERADIFAQGGTEERPALSEMVLQGRGLILREDEDLPEMRVEAVTQRKVDEAVAASEPDRGFGALGGERPQSRALPPGENTGHHVGHHG